MTPTVTVFREVRAGDIRKLQAQSNDSPSGGGARDVRFRGERVANQLLRMFSRQTQKRGVKSATVYWEGKKGTTHTTAELWRPTNSREDEVRVTKVYRIGGWGLTSEEFKAARAANRLLFFVLTLDSKGRTWASIFDELYLTEQTPLFRQHLKSVVAATRRSKAVTGGIDFVKGETF